MMSYPPGNSASPTRRELTEGADRRKHHRYEVIWSGVVHLTDNTHVECAIVDLSAEGAQVLLGQPIAQNCRVFFVSPRFETVSARIVWTEGPRAGLQFFDGIDRVLHVLGGKYGDVIKPVDLASLQSRASRR